MLEFPLARSGGVFNLLARLLLRELSSAMTDFLAFINSQHVRDGGIHKFRT